MEIFLEKDNKYFTKLKDWYSYMLEDYNIGVLYVDKEEERIFSVAYLLINKTNTEQVEIARIFEIGGEMQISIDYNENITTIYGVKKLLWYANQLNKDVVMEDLTGKKGF